MNILVVDDQTGILCSINKLLSRLGYNCFLFVNPLHAIEAYAPDKFDAIVCDFKMPGMMGDEFLERVLSLNPEASVIIMSGYANEQEARELVSNGACAFLEKPLDIEELLRLLRDINLKLETSREVCND